MNCDQIRDRMLDLVAHDEALPVEFNTHLQGCTACATQLEALRSTMKAMDAWTAPEPSPYFDVRLQARLKEVVAEPRPWWQTLLRPVTGWKPAMAMSLAVVLAVGAGIYMNSINTITEKPPATSQSASAVSDLERLDQDQEMLTNFDFTDDASAGSVQ